MPMLERSTHTQRSESFPVGALLAVTGGFLDAYTYLSRDHVFANAQTGNMVLLGLRLSEGRWIEALHYLIPILAFAAGVLLAELIQNVCKKNEIFHWRQLILAIEFIILFLIGFIPDGVWNPYVNIAVSFVCALQVESFRTIHGLTYATTMCTGNLRSGTEQLFFFLKSHERHHLTAALKYYAIIVIFIFGASFGVLSTNALLERAVWIPCALLLLVFLLLHKSTEDLNKNL